VPLRLLLSLWLFISSAAGALAAELQVVMFEQPGCLYCAAWNAEIGPQYPLTTEGKAAPLLRLQLRDPLPEGMSLASRPAYTPTFVLFKDGIEAGRIAGYPGEDFFWPMLAKMIEKAKE
jgi:thioredoxin-related protein